MLKCLKCLKVIFVDFKEWIENKKKNEIKNEYITRCDIVDFLDAVKALIFPGFVNLCDDLSCYLDNATKAVINKLDKLLTQVTKITNDKIENSEIITKFLSKIPDIDYLINTDIDAMFDGDPAAKSKTEIIICYPGFMAIFTYRVAHVFYELGINILPRALSEYAHSISGVDIHPGANIDEYFFIDHGTGIVIGETCVIGKHVKIYQGVTLGALSTKGG
jgi:serine O-acetyltransferase